jgi:hypothetical protein
MGFLLSWCRHGFPEVMMGGTMCGLNGNVTEIESSVNAG